MQAKKNNFLKRLLVLILLAIFSMAITPWSALHHHEKHTTVVEKNCTHNVHVKIADEPCLICKAHFEKNFTVDLYNYIIHLKTELIKLVFPLLGNSFTEIIASCLRGPPSIV